MLFKINIIDDEKNLNDLVRTYLEKEGYSVCSFYTYDEALLHKDDDVHLWLIDIMLDKASGFELFNEIKASKPKMPIIFMSARDQEFDRIIGLEKGSDDYITKPFNILEVKARMKAILRRNNSNKEKEAVKSSVLVVGDMKIDCDSRSLFIKGKEIYLTAKEFDLLELLAFNPNRVYSRDTLLKTVWGADYPGDGRTVDVHIRRLREKIEDNSSDPKYVHTKWGVGYYFNV